MKNCKCANQATHHGQIKLSLRIGERVGGPVGIEKHLSKSLLIFLQPFASLTSLCFCMQNYLAARKIPTATWVLRWYTVFLSLQYMFFSRYIILRLLLLEFGVLLTCFFIAVLLLMCQ